MFPDFDETINEELEGTETQDEPKIELEFDFEKGEFVIKDGNIQTVEGKAALLQWITKLLLTEYKKYEIYEEYGVPTKRVLYADTPKLFKKAELQSAISEKLLEHPDVLGVSEFEFTRMGVTETAAFSCETNYGTIEKEVMING